MKVSQDEFSRNRKVPTALSAGFVRRLPAIVFAALCLLCFGACDRNSSTSDGSNPESQAGKDPYEEIADYRNRVRGFYNGRQFDKLEAEADETRAKKARFRDGAWRIFEYYDSLGCSDDEAEGMWNLHETIHKAWVAAKPDSITARVAQAQFYVDFAWHARGHEYADKVTPEGWRLFKERTETANKILDQAATLKAKCPMWWFSRMGVALALQWPRAEYDKLFEEAKTFEPTFWRYDTSRANYLLPRWFGKPGDWEAAAETEIARPNGLGLEGYARVVGSVRGKYDNIFDESKASWAKTRDGLEIMRKTYPESKSILSLSCQFACMAGDRALAQKLFGELGDYVARSIWVNRKHFDYFRDWAAGTSTGHPSLREGSGR